MTDHDATVRNVRKMVDALIFALLYKAELATRLGKDCPHDLSGNAKALQFSATSQAFLDASRMVREALGGI